MSARYDLAAWTTASAPLVMPNPNCKGDSKDAISSLTDALTHLDASRRSVHPMAMDLKPPSVFCKPMRVAPKKKLASDRWNSTGDNNVDKIRQGGDKCGSNCA